MKKALIVGLNDYPGNELRWCNNDAVSVSELIETNGDGSPNFDVIPIIGKCTSRNLKSAIHELFSDDSEIALFYFSGHGSDEGEGYLVTTDDDGVEMTHLLEKANSSNCKNKIIILDCCFSGKMGENLLLQNRSVLGDGVTIICASQKWQFSSENPDIEHGVFTNLMIQGLNGGAADISGNITPAGLYSFIDQSLGAWEQRPVFKTNISRFLPIRTIVAKVPKNVLRKLRVYFKEENDEFQLDPSFEFTNDPAYTHEIAKPYAVKDNVDIFKELQMLESIGLIEPVNTEHMYFAAMKSLGCKLTALGRHYWRLAKDKRF